MLLRLTYEVLLTKCEQLFCQQKSAQSAYIKQDEQDTPEITEIQQDIGKTSDDLKPTEASASDHRGDSDTASCDASVPAVNSVLSTTAAPQETTIDQKHQQAHACDRRFCGGHEVAMTTELLVQELDMREESIATLLCYLELHPCRWLEVLQPVKSTCTVKFYGGYAQLRSVAQKIPPIAAAVSLNMTKSGSLLKTSTITFPVVEVADKMGWDLAPVCRELRALQWNTSLSRDASLAGMGQSGIMVEFSDLSIHIRAPGDLSDAERDSVCDFLEDRILAEERSSLQQLQFVYDSLRSVSCSEFWYCADDVDDESDRQLKQKVQSYFEDPTDKTKKELAALTNARKRSRTVTSCMANDDHVNWDIITRDIKALVGVHHDHSFTGRALARIFHGIDSPCYPAEVWGRDRRFWRKHLDVEFNSLRKFATRELIRWR